MEFFKLTIPIPKEPSKYFLPSLYFILVHTSHILPLSQILFKNRFKNDNRSNCLLSVDVADFKIPSHGRKYYSHKSKGNGLRYEVGLSIQKEISAGYLVPSDVGNLLIS